MSNAEQDPRAPGSVPNAFGNALAWRWAREMPRALKPGLLTLLYALRAMANASGELRFGSGKPIRIQDLAKAAGADERDVRDRLEAAIRAGVVRVLGERRRGRPALYALAMAPCPDWAAAVAYLDGVKQLREEAKKERAAKKGAALKAGPWADEEADKFEGRTPELPGTEFEGPTPEVTAGTRNEVQGTDPRLSSGDRPPNGSGDRPPNNPGSNQGSFHEVAEVVDQPQVDGTPGTPDSDLHDNQHPNAQTSGWTLCARCGDPMLPRYGRTTHAHCQPITEPDRTAS
ncbi:hypothetical protein [Streptomyces cylindrosporus]|uniref:Helix-turn-helix domain-containing protein n=1 Tax=Streptomyces cylindrosporus TaxID=2927583 RepID=A0ABS9Y352_9ACTN|nr:hypothetical protein [Streptomyces cylindrosporus]MCI3271424.1 hypothetical protein [Streptomyces cylindrosporus]